ncbi:MAG: hypothetical protein ACRCZQ_07045 [Bacteroidales bacterium]
MTLPVRILFNLVICSFYIFPIGFSFMPDWFNTKQFLAVVGLLLAYRNAKKMVDIPNYYLGIFVLSGIFSSICYFSVLYNDTSDYAYANYLLSMSVWLFAVYPTVQSVQNTHDYISLRLILNYLIGICIIQCLLALLIDNNLALKLLVDTYITQASVSDDVLERVERLYGIGAALDPAGVRFAAVLVLIAGVMQTNEQLSKKQMTIYALSFFLIFGLGNMISRTTTVGAIIGIGYMISVYIYRNLEKNVYPFRVLSVLISSAAVMFLAGYYVYVYFEDMQDLIRFGFEAFFNYFESGELKTSSTDILKTMWVFPDNMKTWIIGDAFFHDPAGTGNYYMSTDVGYLRFIFYCGLIGLFSFLLFFVYNTYALCKIYPQYKMTLYLLFLLGLAVWIKVSTDVFQFYAIFFAMKSVTDWKSNNKYKEICE